MLAGDEPARDGELPDAPFRQSGKLRRLGDRYPVRRFHGGWDPSASGGAQVAEQVTERGRRRGAPVAPLLGLHPVKNREENPGAQLGCYQDASRFLLHDGRMVVVLLLNLPGRHRALVDAETAALMVRFGHAKILDDPRPKTPMREARRPRR